MRLGGATIRYAAGRVLFIVGVLAAALAAVTLISGGFALPAGPLALSSRDPVRPLLGAVILLAAARFLLRAADFRRAVLMVTGDRDRLPSRIACAASAGVLVFAVAWNTRAAGGSDSSCYVLQAEAFAQGDLTLTTPFAAALPGATSAMFAPIGFVPSPAAPFAAVPICAPGLALAMAAASLAGRHAVFLVVPLFAALAVWVTFLLGRRIDDAVTGAAAAVLLATSPIFLYQSVQPMSDVPAAALWLSALVLVSGGGGRRQIAAGFCASLAVLMRPNVALIVLPLLLLAGGWRGTLRFGLGAAPGLAAMAWLNAARYGSPLASGYGSADVMFSLTHVGANLARYPRWLFETETPFLAAALIAPWWAWGHRGRGRLVLVSAAAIALTVATYLAYTVFDDWWYIRFLLPALPLLIVLSVAVILWIVSSIPGGAFAGRTRSLVAAGLCLVLGGYRLHVARTHRVFDLQAVESRFAITGRYAARALPAEAVVLAVQQSGSVRYYGARSTIVWDAIPPDALDRTIATIRSAGRVPFIVLEDAEEPAFRGRFPAQRFGRLEWPPTVEIHAPVRVRFYDPAALDRYLAGQRVDTEHVR
jgi:hypothetical protein